MTDDRDKLDQWIDAQLKSPLVKQIESAPPALVQSLHNTFAQRRRKRKYAACGLATAAVLLVAISWAAKLNRLAIDPPQTIASAPETIASAVFIGSDDLIVVPVASRYPNVTIVRVYPVFRSDVMAQVDERELPTNDEAIWSENINGG